jgi:hypothetical protein
MSVPAASPAMLLPPAGETLDAGVALFRHSLLACLPWSIVGVLAGQMGTAYDLARHGVASLEGPKDPQWWLLSIGGGLLNLVVWALIMRRQFAMLEGRPGDWGAAFADLLRRLPALLALVLLSLAAIAAGTLLLVLPGIYLSVALLFAFPAFVIEAHGPVRSLDRALQLVRRRWWYTTAIVSVGFLAILVVLALGIVLGVLAGGLITGGNFEIALVAASMITTLLAALITPFLLALCTVQFVTLRHSGLQ